ncbi:MAG: DUF1786 family protein [Chloroflexota bacterium]
MSDSPPAAAAVPPLLAIDIGAGTQDILLYDPAAEPENCVKLVLPSQTHVVGRRIRQATARDSAVHLEGPLMGGGASSDAALAHIAAGLPLTATPTAAATMHNNPERVLGMGVRIVDAAPAGAEIVRTGDLDLPALAAALAPFGVDLPASVAVAVQDHGDRPGSGTNEVRFEYLQGLLDGGGDLAGAIFAAAPPGMTRMAAVQHAIPGAWVMDTGAAAVLGSLADPAVSRAAAGSGAIVVNFGNMHTFATLVKGRRLYGLFEHHTGGMTTGLAARLVGLLRDGSLDVARFRETFDGHGAALDPAYQAEGPFPFVAVTGPRRAIARPLGFHEAAPHGDMMLAGPWGLVEALRLRG